MPMPIDPSFAGKLVHNVHVNAFEYWLNSCSGGKLPGRQDIDPNDMKHFLPWISLIDVRPGETGPEFTSRLIGTGIQSLFGRNITGKRMEELYEGEYLTMVRNVYSEITEAKHPQLWQCTAPVPDAKPLVYDRLILPLATDGKSVDMLMLVFAPRKGNRPVVRQPKTGESAWVRLA